MSGRKIINVNQMIDFKKELGPYSVSELRKILDHYEVGDKKRKAIENPTSNSKNKTSLIIAATPLEATTFFKILQSKNIQPIAQTINKITLWTLGEIGRNNVIMVKQGEMGSSK
jgi:hypothetical protein